MRKVDRMYTYRTWIDMVRIDFNPPSETPVGEGAPASNRDCNISTCQNFFTWPVLRVAILITCRKKRKGKDQMVLAGQWSLTGFEWP